MGRIAYWIVCLIWIVCLFFLSGISFADEPIYCPDCKTYLYDYKGELEHKVHQDFKAKDFIPKEGIPQPSEHDEMVCPLCKAPLNGYEYWFWKRHRPLPKMVYKAVTLMTKKEGKFCWRPYKVELKD